MDDEFKDAGEGGEEANSVQAFPQHGVKADPLVLTTIVREADGKFRLEINGAKVPAMNVCILQQNDGTHFAQILVHCSHVEFTNDRGKHAVN